MKTTKWLRSREHARMWELLPWYVNGTLQSSDNDAIQKHLRTCSRCCTERSRLECLQETMRRGAALPVNAGSAFNSLLAKIDAEEGVEQNVATPSRLNHGRLWNKPKLQSRGIPATIKWAVAGQGVAVVFLSIALIQSNTQSPTAPVYNTLSETEPVAPTGGLQFRVVFADVATEQQIRELLLSVSGQIVGGPSKHGVYTLMSTSAHNKTSAHVATLDKLRASDVVALAEPL